VAGIVVGIITWIVIQNLIPSQIDSNAAENFFFAAAGINATFLVTIAVTISSILNRTPEQSRKVRMQYSLVQLSIVFIGMIISGLGILHFNPQIPFDHSKFIFMANLVFMTWIIGFILLGVGIWESVQPEKKV
jgi:Na+/proline symporter